MEKTHNVLILGTSNAIFRDAYPHWLGEYDTLCVHQFSLGASTSLIGIYRILQDINLDEYDYAIIDFSINDHDAIFTGIDFNFACTAFLGLLSFFKDSSCMPIILLLCQKKYEFLGFNMHGIIGDFFGVKTIEAHQILCEKYVGQPMRRDQHHYNTKVQQDIASLIYKTIKEGVPLPDYEYFHANPIRMTLGSHPENAMQKSDVVDSFKKTSLVATAVQKMTFKSIISYESTNYLCGMVYWAEKGMPKLKLLSNDCEFLLNLQIHWEALIARQIALTCKGQYLQACTLQATPHENGNISNLTEINMVDMIFSSENPDSYGEKFITVCSKLQILLQISNILHHIKRNDNINVAMQHLEIFLNTHQDPYLLTLCAEILLGIKEIEKAQVILRKSIENAPYYHQSYALQSLLYMEQGKSIEAFAAKRLAEKYNNDPD